MSDQTLNIPSLLLVLVLVFLTVRYFFFSPSFSSSSRSSANRRGGADPAHVEQISSMFPQVGRREIMWDLQRNGGSVAATTERILGGRGLEVVSVSPHVFSVAEFVVARRIFHTKIPFFSFFNKKSPALIFGFFSHPLLENSPLLPSNLLSLLHPPCRTKLPIRPKNPPIPT